LFYGEIDFDLNDDSKNDLYLEYEFKGKITLIKVHVSAIVSSFPGIQNGEEISKPSIVVSMPVINHFIGETIQPH
jgi:hypothetical protein